jgi:hypothetical protein
MSNSTYEFENKNNELETYEWDNVWWEQTNRNDVARVLYIGDSISLATRNFATIGAKDKILFDGFGTSKAVDNPFLLDSIRIFAKQQKYRNAVLFNNGLHGWHLDDDTQYLFYYEKMVKFLIDEFKDTPIFIVLTTSVTDEKIEQRVKRRNEVAVNVANKYGLPIIDLYSISAKFSELHTDDGVHFNDDCSKKFAGQIICDIKNIIIK